MSTLSQQSQPDIRQLRTSNGYNLAYRSFNQDTVNETNPGVIFLCGHGSDMDGTKALFLEQLALDEGFGFTRFDYFGHGASEGNISEGTISIWTDDCLAILDEVTLGPQILVGSSLGGWVMLTAARKRISRIAGLIGIAAAPDFTEDLIWSSLSDSQRDEMKKIGQITLPNPYADAGVVYPYSLIKDGRKNLVMTAPLELDIPVCLFHGMQDHEVPWHTAIKLSNAIPSDNVIIHLYKNAGHRFSTPDQLAAISQAVRVMRASAPIDP